MGTVGLSFGSATSGQGFDVSSTVTQILAAEQAIETPWKTQLTALQAQDTVFSTLGTDLSTLTTDMQTLTDFNSVLSQKQGSSSDTEILTLTSANSTANAGSHTVVVNSLAQTSSDYSDLISNASDTLSGSIAIQVGSGIAQTIAVDSGSNTLSTLASAINSADIGVTASVISDSSGSRLSIVSGTGGTAGQLTITSNLTDTSNNNMAIGFNTGTMGSDGSIKVDGVTLAISSNTVSTAIPGVTFQLLSASAGTSVQVQITNDNSAIASALSSVVSAYNTVVKDLKAQEGKDSSGNAQPLYGSPTIALIQEQLSAALLSGQASGSISSVTQLGLSFNQDGTLSMNSDTLNSVLNSSFSDVLGYLQNSGGFGKTFLTTLNNLGTQSSYGAIYLAQQQNSALETALNKSISDQEDRIAADKTKLTTELNEANQILQGIPSQLDEVNMMYSAISGYNQNKY
jgi:flagellar hook-associated protein 2